MVMELINEDVVRFIEKNNINLENFINSKESYIYNPSEIDLVILKYGFYYDRINAIVSVADIYGYNRSSEQQSNIFLSLSDYFDSYGDEYHSRSIGLLDYSSDEIMEKLKSSFISEPIVVKMISDNKYVISTNGLHRYTVLRAHFLNESYGIGKESEEFRKINKKYEIPVILSNVDLIKTYSKFLLMNNPIFKGTIRAEYDTSYCYTGNVILELSSGQKKVFNDTDLINLVKQIVSLTDLEDYFKLIFSYYVQSNSFREFIKNNLPELVEVQTSEYGIALTKVN
jgi:hypothetical protein